MNNNPTPPVPSPVLPWMREAAKAISENCLDDEGDFPTTTSTFLNCDKAAQLIANAAPKSPPPSDSGEAREIADLLEGASEQRYSEALERITRAITFLRNLPGSDVPVSTAEIGTLEIPAISEEPFKRGCDSVQGAIGYLAAEISRLRSLLINAAPVSGDDTLRRLAREVSEAAEAVLIQTSDSLDGRRHDPSAHVGCMAFDDLRKANDVLDRHLDATPEAERGGEDAWSKMTPRERISNMLGAAEAARVCATPHLASESTPETDVGNSIIEEQARAWCTVASKFDCGPKDKSFCEHVCAEIDRLRGIDRATPLPPVVNAKLVKSLKELSNIVLNGMTADYDEMTAALGRARAALTEAGVVL